MLYDFGDGKGLVEARFHANGGGCVAATTQIDDSVYVDPGCVVFGYARVKDRVRILGKCRVSGDYMPGKISTLIEGDVVISGRVVIEGHVLMRNFAQARNCCKLSGGVALMHHAKVAGRATLAGEVYLFDQSYVDDDVTIISTLKKPIELNMKVYLGGDKIIRSRLELEKILSKNSSKRGPSKKKIKQHKLQTDFQNSVEFSLRQGFIMPTLQDLSAINFSSQEVSRAACA